MITTPIARTVVRFQHRLLRTSLSVLDEQVAGRYLADSSPVRAALHHGLHTLDSTAARLLGPEDVDAAASDEPEPAEQVQRVAEQLLTDPDLAPVTGELADADEDDKRYIAELRAKNIVAEHEAEHGRG